MEDKREVSLERVEKFKKDRGIMFHFETSAKTGENIENLFIFASKVLYHNFKDKIAQSSESEDEYGNKRKSKGHLSEEMVKALNFGRGNEDD